MDAERLEDNIILGFWICFTAFAGIVLVLALAGVI